MWCDFKQKQAFAQDNYLSGSHLATFSESESEVTQLCPTLRDPMDCSLPGSSIHGIFQARVLEWGAITFSKVVSASVAIPWTVAGQAPLSIELPRQEYWSE